MAQGVGTPKQILGSVDTFGGHFWAPIDYSGPNSYVQGGDTVDSRWFGCPNTLFTLTGSVDQSDTYEAVPRALNNGVTKWQLVWRVMSTGLEVAAGVNLSGFTVRLSGIGY
jgi:hypothetical protein